MNIKCDSCMHRRTSNPITYVGNGVVKDFQVDYCNKGVWVKTAENYDSCADFQEQETTGLINIKRRDFLYKMHPSELYIWQAIQSVDQMQAAPELTDVINKLKEAKEMLGDFVDKMTTT